MVLDYVRVDCLLLTKSGIFSTWLVLCDTVSLMVPVAICVSYMVIIT